VEDGTGPAFIATEPVDGEFAVKPATIPIPFHQLLKVVALVDGCREGEG